MWYPYKSEVSIESFLRLRLKKAMQEVKVLSLGVKPFPYAYRMDKNRATPKCIELMNAAEGKTSMNNCHAVRHLLLSLMVALTLPRWSIKL